MASKPTRGAIERDETGRWPVTNFRLSPADLAKLDALCLWFASHTGDTVYRADAVRILLDRAHQVTTGAAVPDPLQATPAALAQAAREYTPPPNPARPGRDRKAKRKPTA